MPTVVRVKEDVFQQSPWPVSVAPKERAMPTVVLVEDDRDLRNMLAEILAEHGFNVVVSPDVLGAIVGIRELNDAPGVVLLDRRIALGAEHEMIEWIRSMPLLGNVPVVLFTTHGSPAQDVSPSESLRDAFDAGSRLFSGRHVFGGTEYLWDSRFPLAVRLLSLFHLFWPALLLWSLRRVGYDRRGFSLQIGIASALLIVSRLVGPSANLNFA